MEQDQATDLPNISPVTVTTNAKYALRAVSGLLAISAVTAIALRVPRVHGYITNLIPPSARDVMKQRIAGIWSLSHYTADGVLLQVWQAHIRNDNTEEKSKENESR